MLKISVLILVIGLFLFGYSFTFNRYTNEQEYNDKYLTLTGPGDSKKFYELRMEYLTPKIELQNYGLTFICTGSALLVFSVIGFNKVKTPNKKSGIIIIGILAAILSNIAYIGDLFLEMYRESYPHWADSLAIPLMGVPVLLLFSLAWTGLNLIGIVGPFKTGVLIFPIKTGNLNYWYLSILAITILMTLILIATGYFWQVLPGFLWTYFYLSILLGKRQTMIEKTHLDPSTTARGRPLDYRSGQALR